jgi:hypothetical protein
MMAIFLHRVSDNQHEFVCRRCRFENSNCPLESGNIPSRKKAAVTLNSGQGDLPVIMDVMDIMGCIICVYAILRTCRF